MKSEEKMELEEKSKEKQSRFSGEEKKEHNNNYNMSNDCKNIVWHNFFNVRICF